MSEKVVNTAKAVENKFSQLEEGEEFSGKSMKAPPFQLFASPIDPNSEGGIDGTDKPRAEKREIDDIKIWFTEHTYKIHLEEILEKLFKYPSNEIEVFWKDKIAEKDRIDFYHHLTPAHYTRYPREIALTLQAIPAADRRKMIAEILDKQMGSHKGKHDDLYMAQVTFLMQGLGKAPFEKPEHAALFAAGSFCGNFLPSKATRIGEFWQARFARLYICTASQNRAA